MAYIIDLDRDIVRRMFAKIQERLKKRGLEIVQKNEWEKHGPYFPEMDYEVFVGPATRGPWVSLVVVVYPRAVYEIDDPKWWNRPLGHEGERIKILRR